MMLVINGEYAVYARTLIEELKAYLYIFRIMDGLGYYVDMPSLHEGWANEARKGDWDAAKKLLKARSDGNYENEKITTFWRIVTP